MSNTKNILTNTFSSPAQEVTSNFLNRTKGDKVIWAIVIMLTMVSILVVYSSIGSLAYKMNKSTESYLFKQIGFIALGVLIIYFAHRVNYTIYSRVATILFLISIPLLIYTLKFGSSINEANRWIKLPVINMTFQTSDLAKLALFMYMSRQLSRRQNVIKDFKKGFLPLIVPVIIICLLDCTGKFIYCIIDWRYCDDAYVYWQSKVTAYYAGCWLSINSVIAAHSCCYTLL